LPEKKRRKPRTGSYTPPRSFVDGGEMPWARYARGSEIFGRRGRPSYVESALMTNPFMIKLLEKLGYDVSEGEDPMAFYGERPIPGYEPRMPSGYFKGDRGTA